MKGLRLAIGMFTVFPVRMVDADRPTAAVALRWFPVLGLVLGLVGGSVSLIFWRGSGGGSPLLGAVVAVITVALLTRGLHLDGLADLADGLGSRRPADQALMIMAKSDIGPFGVAAVLAALLLQIAALAAIYTVAPAPFGIVCLVVASVTGRLAALDAARPAVPSARPGGFGALVSGSADRRSRILIIVLVLAVPVSTVPLLGFGAAALMIVSMVIGLALGRLVTAHVRRRLGGVTGDVFGALVEIGDTAALLVLAASLGWLGR